MTETDPSIHSGNSKPRPTGPPKKRRGMIRLGCLFLAAYLMFVALVTSYQRSLIYQPQSCERLWANKAGLPQAVADVTVTSHDGLNLYGWHVIAGSSARSKPVDAGQALSDDRPVVLYFPGNGGNRARRFEQLSTLASLNAHVVLVDYRGYADNAGKPTEEDFARDARSVWNHLTLTCSVPADRIVIYGESLGGGVATRLASELCLEQIEPGGLIAQSTFNSLVAVAKFHFPWLPVSLVLVDRFPSDKRIASVTCPLLQIHGTEDTIVPFRFGQQLFDAAPATSAKGVAKRQFVLPQTDHNDVYSDALNPGSSLVAELKRFLDSVAEVASAP